MEADVSAIRARIEVVENRLTALADHGVDTAGMRSRLTQARDLLEAGDPGDAQTLTDEVAEGVRRLATGAARSSGEVRSAVREQLVGEVREALAGGAAQEVIEQRLAVLRHEVDDRLNQFARQLRDQFARELAQLLAARPWMKDILAERHASPGDSGVRSGVSGLREQVSGLRRRVEVAIGAAAPEDRLQQALDAIAASEEGMTDLVATIADVQAQMGDRMVAMEKRLAELAATPAQTRLTALHIDPGIVPAAGATTMPTAAAPDPEFTVESLLPPGSRAWPFGEDSSLASPAISTADVEALLSAATSDVPAPATVPSAAQKTAAAKEAEPSASALTHGDTALLAPGEASTAGLGLTPQPVTTDIRRRDQRPVDVSVVRRLIEERLAAWKPLPGEGLVSDDDDQLAHLIHLLPRALEDGTVRTALFATLALEAIEKPGALAHLTRLRTFLREELGLAVEQLRSANV